MASCNDSTSFCAAPYSWLCLRVGFSFADELEFKDSAGVAIDITGDDFEMIIKNAVPATIATLTTTPANGLTIGILNTLKIEFTTPVTDAAGTYTYELVWTRPASGEELPILEGKIVVKA